MNVKVHPTRPSKLRELEVYRFEHLLIAVRHTEHGPVLVAVGHGIHRGLFA